MQVDKEKKLFTPEDWAIYKTSFNPTRDQLNKLVMNYLHSTGSLEAAQLFSKETSVQLPNDTYIERRDQVRQAILNDQIDEVIRIVNETSSELFVKNPKLLFKLRLQKLIWYIKENKVIEALAYGQEILAPAAKDNPEMIKELEKALSLIVFNNIENSPLAELTSPLYKLIIADEVNKELLKIEGKEKCDLGLAVKTLKWLEGKVEKHVTFPHFKFA
jgi:hypothetical protein